MSCAQVDPARLQEVLSRPILEGAHDSFEEGAVRGMCAVKEPA